MANLILRRLKKNKSLRLVNLLGLAITFGSIILSYSYVKKELSYDKSFPDSDRIVRLVLQFNDEPVDGRIYGSYLHHIISELPEIEKSLRILKIDTGILKLEGETQIINDFYFADSTFFDLFSVPLISRKNEKILNSKEDLVISESFAKNLFGNADPIGREINLSGRKFNDMTSFVSGVFKDFPETSHFHPDIILYDNELSNSNFNYIYLLLKDNTERNELEQKITSVIKESMNETDYELKTPLMPVTDIHLYSRILKELEPNGNIYFINLIAGANIILLVIVLFNLWLNSNLIFSHNKRFYQLLRLNGGSANSVLRDESSIAFLLSLISILTGWLLIYLTINFSHFPFENITVTEIVIFSVSLILITIFVSDLPVISNMAYTSFKNENEDMRPLKFSFSNVKYMLVVEYCIVIFVIIVTIIIGNQLSHIKKSQVGGNDQNILVMDEQPPEVNERFALLKTELLKYPEIESVTSAMQLPGTISRDAITLTVEGDSEKKNLPILIVDYDFFSFFKIKPIAGKTFSPSKFSFNEEMEMYFNHASGNNSESPVISEEYVINEKAARIFGFKTPEDAIGKYITLENHPSLQYIPGGIITGVTEDFNYATVYEESKPYLIMNRQLFMHSTMVKFDPEKQEQAVAIFNNVWNKVNPDYPAHYTFMPNIYGKIYKNEIYADRLVRIFSLLCLIITNLGLIIFMAFIVKSRTKEIAIRKINGAREVEILKMLNLSVLRWIIIAFIIAVPIAYFIMRYWLQNFVYKTPLSWWVFAIAGIIVIFLSVIFISLQSWKTATSNPVNSLKAE